MQNLIAEWTYTLSADAKVAERTERKPTYGLIGLGVLVISLPDDFDSQDLAKSSSRVRQGICRRRWGSLLVEEVDPADEQTVYEGYIVEFCILFL